MFQIIVVSHAGSIFKYRQENQEDANSLFEKELRSFSSVQVQLRKGKELLREGFGGIEEAL